MKLKGNENGKKMKKVRGKWKWRGASEIEWMNEWKGASAMRENQNVNRTWTS